MNPCPKPPAKQPKQREPIQRTRIRTRRTKARPGRVARKDKEALYEFVWNRDKGICQACRLPCSRDEWHPAHIRNKRMWGDSPDNIRVKHPFCHLVIEHAYGPSGIKPVPKKGYAMNIVGGVSITGGTSEQMDVLRRRSDFIAAYCREKGWDVNDLDLTQVMEIRAQGGWKNPAPTTRP